MRYKKINVELIVVADQAEAVVAEFRACMGARSLSEKSIFLLSSAPYDLFVFLALTSMSGEITLKGVTRGTVPKEAYMGMAAASYWLIGGMSRSSSMERTMELVE
jgi:hypothetical protein